MQRSNKFFYNAYFDTVGYLWHEKKLMLRKAISKPILRSKRNIMLWKEFWQ